MNFNFRSSIRIIIFLNKCCFNLTTIYLLVFFLSEFSYLLRKLTVINYSIWSGICPEWPIVAGYESKDIFSCKTDSSASSYYLQKTCTNTRRGTPLLTTEKITLVNLLSKVFLYIIESLSYSRTIKSCKYMYNFISYRS